MKAVVYNQFGSSEVLEMKNLEKPIPQADEVLIRIEAVAINKGDTILLKGKPFLARPMVGTFFKPRKDMILGSAISGQIESVGSLVKDFKIGDAVFGDLSYSGFGGFAEYVCAKVNSIVIKSEKISFEEAASIPVAGVTALKSIRDVGKIRPGQKVLIHGASGGVGSYAVQIAKAFGGEVTAVCSTKHIEWVKSLGADHVIDYTKDKFSQNKVSYDLIYAVNGKNSIFTYKSALSHKGIYVMSGGATSQMFEAMLLGPLLSKKEGKQLRSVSNKPDPEALQFLMMMMQEGRIKPIIDAEFSFESAVEALKFFEIGQSKGKVIIHMNPKGGVMR